MKKISLLFPRSKWSPHTSRNNNHSQSPTFHPSSFAPVPSSYSLHFLLPATPSHLHQVLSKMHTADKSIFANFDVTQNSQMKSTVSCSCCFSSLPATPRTKKEPTRPKISHTPRYRTFVFSEHKIQFSEREPSFQRIISPV